MTEFLPLYLNVRTVVGLTTVSRKNLSKKTGCRGRGLGMTPKHFAKRAVQQRLTIDLLKLIQKQFIRAFIDIFVIICILIVSISIY
ncbi:MULTISPECIES: hypothetical protein [unclassified Rickettsia]|uniref:hypothetical protein n=1 Tax=unclassified Rickettsia TaxID=114295 RepID=UPI0031333EB6